MPRVFKRGRGAPRPGGSLCVPGRECRPTDSADRFLACAEASFVSLSEHPEIGAALTLVRPALAELRKWRIREFENFLHLFFSRALGFSIVRVLYATQDWWQLFGVDGP